LRQSNYILVISNNQHYNKRKPLIIKCFQALNNARKVLLLLTATNF